MNDEIRIKGKVMDEGCLQPGNRETWICDSCGNEPQALGEMRYDVVSLGKDNELLSEELLCESCKSAKGY